MKDLEEKAKSMSSGELMHTITFEADRYTKKELEILKKELNSRSFSSFADKSSSDDFTSNENICVNNSANRNKIQKASSCSIRSLLFLLCGISSIVVGLGFLGTSITYFGGIALLFIGIGMVFLLIAYATRGPKGLNVKDMSQMYKNKKITENELLILKSMGVVDDRDTQTEEKTVKISEKDLVYITDNDFYTSCKEKGVCDASSEANIARILLIAENLELTGSKKDIIQKFEDGKSNVEEKQKKDRIAKLTEKEKKLEIENAKYVLYKGREKAIQMCMDKATNYRNEEQEHQEKQRVILKSATGLYNSTAEREHSWALRGGFVSGIAGGAAGVAAAIDTQNQNEEIRRKNGQLKRDIDEVASIGVSYHIEKAAQAALEAKKWEKLTEQIKIKLVQELPQEELMAMLNPNVKSLSVSETGAVLIDVEVEGSRKHPLTIYQSVSAVVDGFFCAKLWLKDENIGQAIFALPWNGANYNTTLHGICRKPLKPAERYEITFEPYNLWAIEEIK